MKSYEQKLYDIQKDMMKLYKALQGTEYGTEEYARFKSELKLMEELKQFYWDIVMGEDF